MAHPKSRVAVEGRWRSSGFSLLEVVAVLLVMFILVALVAPNYQMLVNKAQSVICTYNMRSIRNALDNYLQDHERIWPQGPGPREPIWATFWLETLQPYDVTARTWQCPTIRGMMAPGGPAEDLNLTLHYVPTMFDATPNIAFRWSTQPWLIEVADAHGNGPLICFPDGSVKPFAKVLAEQGAR